MQMYYIRHVMVNLDLSRMEDLWYNERGIVKGARLKMVVPQLFKNLPHLLWLQAFAAVGSKASQRVRKGQVP